MIKNSLQKSFSFLFINFLLLHLFGCSALNKAEFESQEEVDRQKAKQSWLVLVKEDKEKPEVVNVLPIKKKSAKKQQKNIPASSQNQYSPALQKIDTKVNLVAVTQENFETASDNKEEILSPRSEQKILSPTECVFKRPEVFSKSVVKEEETGNMNSSFKPLSAELNPRLWGTEKSKALKFLPRDKLGHYVDWVAAVDMGLISPRGSLDPNGEEKPMYDLDVLLEVSNKNRNNVCFPHSIHTYWFDCENCHPEIFTMKRMADPISMVKIIKGEYCGRCHGKVAFHVANNCDRCHNTPKPKSISDYYRK